MTHTQVVK